MAINSKITLTNAQVNSGAAIDMASKNISTNWEIYTNVPDKPHRNYTDTYDTRLSKGINTGFANPEHTVSGVYNINGTHGSGANALIDFEFILAIISRADVVMTLTCDKFKTTTNTTGTVYVMLTGYSDGLSNENQVGYSMVFKEVNSGS